MNDQKPKGAVAISDSGPFRCPFCKLVISEGYPVTARLMCPCGAVIEFDAYNHKFVEGSNAGYSRGPAKLKYMKRDVI